MLGHLLVFTLYILTMTCLPVDKAEICIDQGVEFSIEYASVGEPLYAVCPLQYLLERNNFTVTWIRINSETEITSNRQARVHQDQQYLKFIPAKLQDSGIYQCILRNSTNCFKKIRRVEVFRHDNGLCYNNSVMFRKQKPIAPSLTIECPHLDIYFGHKNVQVRWFKECQPLDLDSMRYSTSAKNLIIKDLSSQDSGIYTCQVPLVYNGVTYNLSQAIEYTILDPPEPEAVIIFPKNNIIDVELGTPLTLTCKVLFNESLSMFWAYNGTPMVFYTEDDRVVMGNTDQTFTEDGLQHFKNLNFTKVIEEDYNRQFYCHAWTPKNRVFMFYVSLKRPDPNFQGFLIAFFVSVILVTVISIVVIRIYKVDIVLWYRSSCFVNVDHKDGKLYDAYIICPKKSMGTSSYEMDIFVLKVLPEVLEKQCGYRLFISGRDDLPGQAMTDLVDETIAQSRRVFIILGNIFCEDRCDDFEHKIAMYDALIQNKIKVVLIEMEKITEYSNMPESIKYLKQKQGAVRWKGEFTEAALSPNTRFWKNIRYQMPPAQRPSDRELHYIHSED